jgi:uncharacterized membrane protein YidH (DUF202 family)
MKERTMAETTSPVRPKRFQDQPLPAIPNVGGLDEGVASVTLSQHRTHLSTFRTGLSEHRTDLSEYRTDLSTDRTEMSMRRTGMSFQRTRMSADRTLMSVIRTSLSLIGFGFTIFQFFQKLRQANQLGSPEAALNFGLALVALGIGMLVLGIVYHVQFMLGLRHVRHEMAAEGLIHGESRFPVSLTLITAVVLLLVGVAAMVSMTLRVGPFG